MSANTASISIERDSLSKAWLVVAAIVIAAATVVALGLMRTSQAGNPGVARNPSVGTTDLGPIQVWRQPIVIDGKLCGQCR
jgi:hypothetical protein